MYTNLCTALLLLLASAQMQIGTGCSCFRSTFADRFKSVDYAIIAQILEELPPMYPPGFVIADERIDFWAQEMATYQYKLQIKDVLKKDDHYDAARKVVQTVGGSGLCGIRLQTNHTYFLMGYLEEDVTNKDRQVLGQNLCMVSVDIDNNPEKAEKMLLIASSNTDHSNTAINSQSNTLKQQTSINEENTSKSKLTDVIKSMHDLIRAYQEQTAESADVVVRPSTT